MVIIFKTLMIHVEMSEPSPSKSTEKRRCANEIVDMALDKAKMQVALARFEEFHKSNEEEKDE